MENWGIDGRIPARDLVQIGRRTLHGCPVECLRLLFRAALIDLIADFTHVLYAHQSRSRIRQILEGLRVFMLSGPTLRADGPNCGDNYTLLENFTESTDEVCEIVAKFILHAMTTQDIALPVVIPVALIGAHVRKHESGIVGLFEYIKCFDPDGNMVVPYYGTDHNGRPL